MLGELLGSGAMGQVYQGVDKEGGQFAFKLLRSDLVDDPEFVARFHQERSILMNLRGQHLVAVHDLVVEGDTAAIVMDLVLGGSLRDLLTRSGTILPAEVARIGAGIADALHHVHVAGIVHRDVKPENVLMDSATPKLTDFGISKMTGASKVGRSTLLAGTPNYVAPEVADGRDITPAADLYSLGIVLYELCCGVTPFAGDSVFQVLKSHGEMAPGRPDGIPDELWDVISSLLQKNPAARPRSAEQVAAVLMVLADRLLSWPVGDRLDKPPAAIPLNHGNDNETVLRVSPKTTASSQKPKRRKLPLVLSTIVLLGAAGGGYALASRTSTDNSSTTATSTPGGVDADGARGTASTSARATTTQEIRLTSMPNLVGKKLGEARDLLPKSMNVEIIEQVTEDKPDGEVLSQEPAAGQPVDNSAKLTVARPAVTVYLDAVRPASGQWGSGGDAITAGMAGKPYLHSLASYTRYYCTADLQVVEYNVSKGYRRLVTTAGITDSSQNTAMKVQLEIFGDGRQLTSKPIEYGTVVPLDIDLTNVLRLKIQWVITSNRTTCGDNYFVLGEAKLLGLAGEVPTSGVPAAPTSTTTTTR
ncbi:protein kinase [Lentzea sp. NBRC 105346]|uniref:protein kinase domain-containing protein n=1 Tax=Lentzea sp. NBRC 105346 TaxID=3032205 RepID=UPI0025521E0E|nr:protein kinase [Lentzea sp. NBRC 105346]